MNQIKEHEYSSHVYKISYIRNNMYFLLQRSITPNPFRAGAHFNYTFRRVGYHIHYLIIAKTYNQRDNVRERDGQRDNFQNCYIFVERREPASTGRRVSMWTVTRFSCFTHRVHNRSSVCVGVFRTQYVRI